MWQMCFPFSIPHACNILHINNNIYFFFFFFFYFPLGLEEILLKSRCGVVIPLFTSPPHALQWLPIACRIKSQIRMLLPFSFFQPLLSCFLTAFPFNVYLSRNECLVPECTWLFRSFVCPFSSDWVALSGLPHLKSTSISLQYELFCEVRHFHRRN